MGQESAGSVSSCGKNNDCEVVMVIMMVIKYGGSRNYSYRDDSY